MSETFTFEHFLTLVRNAATKKDLSDISLNFDSAIHKGLLNINEKQWPLITSEINNKSEQLNKTFP